MAAAVGQRMDGLVTPQFKQLRIQVGVVRRLKKELLMYKKEFEKNHEVVERMRADGADAHDIKQQVR